MSLETIPLFLVAGGLAGFVNAVAGGGSLFSFPLLVLLGYPAQVANGTIRLSILMQNVVAVPTYAREGFFFPKQVAALAAVAIPAALVGANVAARLDPEPFRNASAILLVLVLGSLFLKGDTWQRRTSLDRIRWRLALPLVAAVGFYGGFFQIGAGVIFLAATVLGGGWDLVSANSMKVAVVLLYTTVSLVVFATFGQVDWIVGFALGVGNMIGAWIGARTAARKGPGWIRWVLVSVTVLAAVKLVFDKAG